MRKVIILLLVLNCNNLLGLDANGMLKQVDEAMYPTQITYTAEMTIYRPKKEYKKLMRVYIKGYDKALVEFLEPPKERGLKILMKEDDVWMYLPSVEKVVRLTGRMKMMGGEFVHDDIMRVRLSLDYNAESLQQEDNHCILQLNAKNKKVTYDKIKYWIREDNYLPVKAEFYTIGGKLLKILKYSEPKKFGERLMPSKLIMENAFTKDYKTTLEIISCDYSYIPDRLFTQEYLKKGL
ncbi:MAG: outer membrane lipoprotein-sorting protein [bacterium]|nr:outer membrane lipoprotein-sorting protein [bacterium]